MKHRRSALTRSAALTSSRGKVYFFLLLFYLALEYTKFQDVLGLEALRLGLFSVLLLLVSTFFNVNITKINNNQILLIGLFCLYLVVFVPFARNNYFAFHTAKGMLIYLPVIYSIVHLINDEKSLNRLILFFVLVSVYLSVYVLTNRGYGPAGTVRDANDVALALVFLTSFSLFLFRTANSNKYKWVYLLVTILVIAAIAYTRSRGGFLGLSAVLGVYVLFSHHKLKAILMALVIVSVFTYTADDDFLGEISSITDTSESTASSRLLTWKDATKMFLDNPLGVGPGNFPIRFDEYQSEEHARGNMWGRSAHSLWFTLLPETGILGTAIFALIIMRNFSDIRLLGQESDWHSKRESSYFYNLRICLLASFCGLLVSGTFISVLYYQHFWLFSAIVVASRNIYLNRKLAL
ncbi:O-antigen ligase family protein [Wenzhouxiangella sp. XN24]|uniref:O-antigen ligase family protein n=1 Tax=Wenzhouxiangella sp. XN24 TaxID=2713569 RepID=UPI0013EBB24F|nr:O-antigen ligase family protein [Wenzhouxiangella sp. XN24]NGX17087.1 hypothetical protein [Wenzhouxiangella sp. XN24]